MSLQVANGLRQKAWVIAESAETKVAGIAKQAANFSRQMTMVDVCL